MPGPARRSILAENPRGVLLYDDELAGVFRRMNQYRDGADRQFYLQAHAGGSYTNDRKSGGTVHIENLYLNIFGGFQPEAVREAFANDIQDGMAQRFSVMVWPDMAKEFVYIDRPPDREAKEAAHDMIIGLRDLDPEVMTGGEPIRFDEEGQRIFVDWYTGTQQRIRSGVLDPEMAQHLSKYPGLFARLACVHHLIRYRAGLTSRSAIADAATAEAVLEFVTYLQSSAQRIYRYFGKARDKPGAERIADWIRKEKPTRFRAGDIDHKGWREFRDQRYIDKAIERLVDADWIRPRQTAASPKGGRPTIDLIVNPTVRR